VSKPLGPKRHRVFERVYAECERRGVDPVSQDGGELIYALLSLPTRTVCGCGAQMAVWEVLNGKCGLCKDKALRVALQRETGG